MAEKKKFEKVFIGKGKQVEGMDITKVTIKASEVMNCGYYYKGELYLTFEVARLQQPDMKERTHTCYYQKEIKED